ncbi:Pectinesterase/pectinesterase inhibitor PPE8B, partial [Thalictrum thalictroides]
MKNSVVVVAAAVFDDNEMEFEADELNLTISATENPNAKEKFSTGNRRSDLKTWLNSALGNQDTCQDGFDGTNSFVKNIIGGSLGEVTSLVTQMLGMVAQGPSNNIGDLPGENDKFPSWMKVSERGLLQGSVNGVMADVVVAKDGSGHYTTITDAILAAPNNSTRRYVIYIKKGVYHENVEIKKKKWNLMMVGDGMGVTVSS